MLGIKPQALTTANGIAELWAHVANLAKPAQKDCDNDDNEDDEPKIKDEDDDVIFEFDMPGTDNTTIPSTVKASALEEDNKMVVDGIWEHTKTMMKANITFLSQDMDDSGEMIAEFLKTPAAKFTGEVAPRGQKGGVSQYTGIFFDCKISGESNVRPDQRIPRFRYEPYERFLNMVLNRQCEPNSTPENVENKEAPPSDLYFLFDGGTDIGRGNGEIGRERMGIERGEKEFNRSPRGGEGCLQTEKKERRKRERQLEGGRARERDREREKERNRDRQTHINT